MRVQKCKGTRDLSPQEMAVFRFIEGAFRECCLKWGYQEVRTPTIEYLHLFTSTGTLTPSMLGKVYSFLDWDGWSGERVVLRPDGTIPVARFYIDEMSEKALAKLFYIASVFIFEETGKETRERWQCGAELIGAGSTAADVELIILALETLRSLGLTGVEIRLSHAGLIRALLARLGVSPDEQVKLFDQILDGDTAALAKMKQGKAEPGHALSLLLDQTGKSAGFLKNLGTLFSNKTPELERSLHELINIVELLDALGYQYTIDISSGRGFEYYTGLIFQLFTGKEKIGGGGRYDALIPLMGGADTPASGFALYLDHLMNQVKPAPNTMTAKPEILISTEPDRPETLKEGFALANRLHRDGYLAEINLGNHEPSNFKWLLNIQSRQPRIILTDRVKNQKFEAKDTNEVLTLLGEKRVDKDSAT